MLNDRSAQGTVQHLSKWRRWEVKSRPSACWSLHEAVTEMCLGFCILIVRLSSDKKGLSKPDGLKAFGCQKHCTYVRFTHVLFWVRSLKWAITCLSKERNYVSIIINIAARINLSEGWQYNCNYTPIASSIFLMIH